MKRILALLLVIVSAWFLVEPSHAGYPSICVGCWYKFPNSKLDSSSALPGTIPDPGGGAYRTIFTAWGGGAFDPDSNRFLVHGGGHGDYSGNEVYSFSVDSSKWFRIKGPGTVTTYNVGSEYYNSPADSQSPRSQHTKDRLQVCPDSSDFYTIPTNDLYSDAGAGRGIHLLDLKSRSWSRPDTLPYDSGNGVDYTNGTYPISSYDSVTNRIWYHGMNDGHSWLISLNCATQRVSSHGGYWSDDLTDLGSVGSGTGAVDVKRRRLYNFGQSQARYWALTNPGTSSSHTSFTPTGPNRIYAAVAPGLDYSYRDTTIVGYSGGDTVFTFNSVTNVWTAVPPDAANTVHPPTSPQANGTFGRFRYVKNGNFFIYVHSADSSVYAYRLSADAGGGSSTPAFRRTLLGTGR